MSRAIVIKTAGDPKIAGAIVDGMTLHMGSKEMQMLKAEIAKMKEMDDLHRFHADREFKAFKRELRRKYPPQRPGLLVSMYEMVFAVIIVLGQAAYNSMRRW